MGDSLHSKEAQNMAAGSSKTDHDSSGKSSLFLILTILGGAAGLAAAVWFPTAGLVEELTRLVDTLEKHGRAGGQGNSDVPRDCYDILLYGHAESGIYKIYPEKTKRGFEVFCDMETENGGWLVILKRFDGTIDFELTWPHYQFGFGNLTGEFWLGNEMVHLVTSQGWYEILIELEDFDGEKRTAHYKLFSVGGRANHFQLTIEGYSGDAGDAMAPHDGMFFSTYDKDLDASAASCAERFRGGWWYNNCHAAILTGKYFEGEHESVGDGINWDPWRGLRYSLKLVEMKIRPRY